MKYKILWADDEIDLLKPHILFLNQKGYEVVSVNNGMDALDIMEGQSFDVVFLDENMPGKSGLEILVDIKANYPSVPVVMITKSEEEYIMEEAIGAKIADYLIKPLNPNQILLSVKKILDNQRIISERTNLNYSQEFSRISQVLNDDLDHHQWADLYKKLVYWELQIDQTQEKSMSEVLLNQKDEANQKFSDFIADTYSHWLNDPDADKPLLSNQVLKKKVFPLMGDVPVVLIVIDNLRLDQWEIIEPEVLKLFEMERKEHYYSILPTTTAYARNALFSGLMPLDIEKQCPDLWVGEDEESSKNNFESELLGINLNREKVMGKYSYH
ncbi:MAG: response regulator, partial [Cyclobacteriaceae bacterium]|nr:response regulator [Cyclobacteriaceae bacterium]